MNKLVFTIIIFYIFAFNSIAQNSIKGIVYDDSGNAISGVKVFKVGNPKIFAITDYSGSFDLSLAEGDYIELNYADKLVKRVKVEEGTMSIVLDSSNDQLLDMGFVKRTIQTNTQSVSSASSELLSNNATSTSIVNNSIFGLIVGLQASQNTGWQSIADLRVRGLGGLEGGTPLFIVDGFSRGTGNMLIEEIESINILKDGASTALWGIRGANGVVLVNTKRGAYKSFGLNINYRHGFNFPINQPIMVDALTYAKAHNEALLNDGLPLQYSESQLDQIEKGDNLDFYPNVNWVNEGMRDMSESNQFNLELRGGGEKVRYMGLVDYKNESGLLSSIYTKYNERFNSQIRKYDLSLRMNIDIDVTPTTQARLSLFGTIIESTAPNKQINLVFQDLYAIPSVAFPIKTSSGNWGSNLRFQKNPIADFADLGYIKQNRRILNSDLRIIQGLDGILKGLSLEAAVAYDNMATFQDIGSKEYLYEVNYIGLGDLPVTQKYGANKDLEVTQSTLTYQLIRNSMEGKLQYDYAKRDNQISVALLYRQEMQEPMEIEDTYRRQSIMGVFNYNYGNKYLLDVVANYHGSSVLFKGDKFRFYPAISFGWNLHNEDFFNSQNINLLKVRTSWGISGLDALPYGLDNYFWNASGRYRFGNGLAYYNGLREYSLPMQTLEPETSNKFDFGIDLRLIDNLSFTTDVYFENRSNILVNNRLISSMLGVNPAKENFGQVNSYGIEFDLGWSQVIKDFTYFTNLNIAFNGSRVVEDGQAFQPYDYLYSKGHKVGQVFGLEAIGYFNDQNDIDSSPIHTFSPVSPGDIKYRDQNNDGVVDVEDRIAIGKSQLVPEMVFGFNFGFMYKNFSISGVIDGVGGISKFLNVTNVNQPIRVGESNISTWYLKDRVRWSESTKETANLPRLSTLTNENNYQTSTQWLVDGSFIKLRSLNLGYTLPKSLSDKINIKETTIYLKALNIFSIDKVDYFNVEDIRLGYPDVFSVFLGVNLKF